MGIVQVVVPFATPDLPPDAVHVTDFTRLLSDVVPEIRTLAAEVENTGVAGYCTRRVGADLSDVVVTGGPSCVGVSGSTGGVALSRAGSRNG